MQTPPAAYVEHVCTPPAPEGAVASAAVKGADALAVAGAAMARLEASLLVSALWAAAREAVSASGFERRLRKKHLQLKLTASAYLK